MKTDTETLIAAMRVLARDIQSEDGVANSAIAEAADRLEHLKKIVDEVWNTFYGENLQVANWHKNGELEPMDTFFESSDWSDT